MPGAELISDDSITPAVRGYLHRPDMPDNNGLILTHGAGSNAQAPLLIALAERLSEAGVTVLRCDLPYRQARRFGPPGPGDAARDRQGLKNALAVLRKHASARIFLGGHSYGGRQATMLCAEEPALVDGLLLLSYPLHPPRKPDQLRTQHLPNLRNSGLFVQGTRDPFGSVEEVERAIQLIRAKTFLLPIEAAGHDLGFKGKMRSPEVVDKIREKFLSFFFQADS
jgi:predicted alpha/beta-hydrolase family hydrolase